MNKNILKIQMVLMPDFLGLAFAYGNAKIPRSTLIINITSAEHCPSKARGLCHITFCCYAGKCERIYPFYKRKNLFMERWLYQTPTHKIIQLIAAYIKYAPEPIKCIRINEAGDFINQNQIVQWNKIAGYFFKTYGISTYTYTARTDLDFTVAPYIIVNGSLPGVKGALREFICMPRNVFDNWKPGPHEYKCPGDCKICHLCSSRVQSIQRVGVRQH